MSTFTFWRDYTGHTVTIETDADLPPDILRRLGITRADIPVVPHIDAAILVQIEGGGKLRMAEWHTCATTHCRGGWAITLAGVAGAALEDKIGSAGAGVLIYAVSRPGVPIPDFYCSDAAAMADLRACAARDPLP